MTSAAPRRFRLYVDESGNHDLDPERRKPAERYLSLTGLIVDYRYAAEVLTPAIEELKTRHLGSHPDEPITLHRRDIMECRGPFAVLRDPVVRTRFDRDLLALMRNLEYLAVTVVIDKWDHRTRYREWAAHPYHYCMEVLVERYVLELRSRHAVGDVMAENRGGGEDRQLRTAFTAAFTGGTDHLRPAVVQAHLTSRELKLKPKIANVAGIQLADLLAYPAAAAVRARHDGRALPTGFTGSAAAILRDSKWRRRPDGVVDGWGTKWLP